MGICQSRPIDSAHRPIGEPSRASATTAVRSTRQDAVPPVAAEPTDVASLTTTTPVDPKARQLKVLIRQIEFLLTIGGAQDWVHSTIDTTELSAALSEANVALLENSEEGKAVLARARLTLDVRRSLVGEQWAQLAEQLAAAVKAGVRSPEISSAQDELAHHQQIEETCGQLRRGLDERDVAGVAAALKAAQRLRVGESSALALVETAQASVAAWQQALEQVAAALSSKEYAALRGALVACQTADLCKNNASVSAATVLLAGVTRVRELALLGLHYAERSLLTRACDEAEQLDYVDDAVRRARELLSLGAEQFLRAQYQCAVTLRQRPRADALSVQLKARFFAAHAVHFRWQRYAGLRSRADFAAASVFGRQAARKSMLRWTDARIAASLTRLGQSKPLLKAAVRCFNKLLLPIVNDAASKQLPALQQSVLDLGVAEPLLRDEIFVQLLKMLTDTPARDAYLRARATLALALQCFLPSPAFEPYLEAYLHRQDVVKSSSSLNALLSIMHDSQLGYNTEARRAWPKAPKVAQLHAEQTYQPHIAAEPPCPIDPQLLDSMQDDRPDLAWLQDDQAQRRIADILARPLGPDSAAADSASSDSQPHSEDPLVDVEEQLREWEQLAAQNQANASSSSLSSSSDSSTDDSSEEEQEVPSYRVRAAYAYKPDGEGKIAIKPGHVLLVSAEEKGGWLYGKNEKTGEEGYFPKSYVQAMTKQEEKRRK